MKRHEHPNAKRWLNPPTIEQVDTAVAKSGASEPMFESYHGMSIGCIAKFRCGFRNIPLKHWHLFLEDKPQRLHNNIHKIPPTHSIPTSRSNSSGTLGKLVS